MKNTLSTLINTASILLMLRFAGSKLMGAEISVKSFEQFASVLPINGPFFMYFVGGLELLVALILVAVFIARDANKEALLLYTGNFLLIGTLIGALFTEFLIRPEPVFFLVALATGFLLLSGLQMGLYYQQLVKPSHSV